MKAVGLILGLLLIFTSFRINQFSSKYEGELEEIEVNFYDGVICGDIKDEMFKTCDPFYVLKVKTGEKDEK